MRFWEKVGLATFPADAVLFICFFFFFARPRATELCLYTSYLRTPHGTDCLACWAPTRQGLARVKTRVHFNTQQRRRVRSLERAFCHFVRKYKDSVSVHTSIQKLLTFPDMVIYEVQLKASCFYCSTSSKERVRFGFARAATAV